MICQELLYLSKIAVEEQGKTLTANYYRFLPNTVQGERSLIGS